MIARLTSTSPPAGVNLIAFDKRFHITRCKRAVSPVMLAVVGLAIDDHRWVALNPAGQSATWWLPAAMVAAGAVGFLFGISRVSTAGSHLIAAGIGARIPEDDGTAGLTIALP